MIVVMDLRQGTITIDRNDGPQHCPVQISWLERHGGLGLVPIRGTRRSRWMSWRS